METDEVTMTPKMLESLERINKQFGSRFTTAYKFVYETPEFMQAGSDIIKKDVEFYKVEVSFALRYDHTTLGIQFKLEVGSPPRIDINTGDKIEPEDHDLKERTLEQFDTTCEHLETYRFEGMGWIKDSIINYMNLVKIDVWKQMKQ